MKSQQGVSYLLLVTAGAAVVFGFSAFLTFIEVGSAVRHTNFWWMYPLMGTLGSFAIGAFQLRSRGLTYSATMREFGAATIRDYGSDGQRLSLAEFNHANTGLLRSSLFLYWAVLILVWTAASFLGASPAMAFVVTMAAFTGSHGIRIAQLKELPDISFGFGDYARTVFGMLVAAGVSGGAFWYTLTEADFSWKIFWLVAFGLVLISPLSVHADFAIVSLFRRPVNN
ncbi:MAG: hypothetical protein ACLQDM_25560 [Bradyrhizobium sp.]